MSRKRIFDLLGVLFLVVLVSSTTYLAANPSIRQLISSQARYNPDALIRQRERTGECTGSECLTGVKKTSDGESSVNAPKTCRTNAECGVGYICEETVCLNKSTGQTVSYGEILKKNEESRQAAQQAASSCGDATCSTGETADSCPADCGAAATPTPVAIADTSSRCSITSCPSGQTKVTYSDGSCQCNPVSTATTNKCTTNANCPTGYICEDTICINRTNVTIHATPLPTIAPSLSNVTGSAGGLISPKSVDGDRCSYNSNCDSGYCAFSGNVMTCQQKPVQESSGTIDQSKIIDNAVGYTDLEKIYNNLNEKTFGAFGLYVSTFQDINAQNPTVSNDLNPFTNPDYYTKKVFNHEAAAAAGILTVSATTGRIGLDVITSRDVFIEDIKYNLSKVNTSSPDTFYLIGPDANKQVYEKNGIIYDAKNNQAIGSKDSFAGYNYVQQPKTVYAGNTTNFVIGEQHTTITQETLQDPVFQKINDQVQAGIARTVTPSNPLSINELGTINSIVNKNIEYYEPLSWTGYVGQPKPLAGIQQTSFLGYNLTYRTLDNLINNDSSICFDKAISEQIVLASYGIKADLIANNKLGHAYLIVHEGPATFVLDPTKGGVLNLQSHMEENNYTEADTYILPSATDYLPKTSGVTSELPNFTTEP